jgi:hypothetical protein
MSFKTSLNKRKLRHSFSRIVPNLLLGEDAVAFFCDSLPDLSLYSLNNGELVYDKIRASDIVATLMHLKVKGVPWNNVNEKDLTKIQKSFAHIYKEESKSSGLDSKTVRLMRSELNHIFKEKYT